MNRTEVFLSDNPEGRPIWFVHDAAGRLVWSGSSMTQLAMLAGANGWIVVASECREGTE
jgi:sugar lactone lactonase YvrE